MTTKCKHPEIYFAERASVIACNTCSAVWLATRTFRNSGRHGITSATETDALNAEVVNGETRVAKTTEHAAKTR